MTTRMGRVRHRTERISTALVIAIVAANPTLLGQPANAPPPGSFEVASIRMVQPYSSEELRRVGDDPFGSFPSNHFVARHVPLPFLVSVAFTFDTAHVITSDKWQEDQLYDIAATVPGNQQLTLVQMLPLLRDLLRQRFHLTTHIEERRISGFTLIAVKSGPKLQRSASDAEPRANIVSNRLWGRNVPLATLAGMLERSTGAPVKDQTGLTGNYDFDLRFRADNDAASSSPDIFTAVQEQLGLKLVSGKVPVRYLVIDRVDRVPTEN